VTERLRSSGTPLKLTNWSPEIKTCAKACDEKFECFAITAEV
jgi:hypothetical protein